MSLQNFFTDSEGKRVIVQKPNKPLIFAEIFIAMGLLLDAFDVQGWVTTTTYAIAYVGFFAWGVLEVTAGVNPFRKTLGVAGLLLVLVLAWRRFF